MYTTTTTDLEIIRKQPKKFTWGTIIKIHDVWRYTFVEFVNRSNANTEFHIYVDGKDTNQGAVNVEGAFLVAISRGCIENVNEANWMARAAVKLLNVKEESDLKSDLSTADKDVHTEHCCINCGCKYGDKDCTVTAGNKKQSFPCSEDI